MMAVVARRPSDQSSSSPRNGLMPSCARKVTIRRAATGSDPQIHISGFTKYNIPRLAGNDYKPLTYHGFMHAPGFMHAQANPLAESKATCIGASLPAPSIDDLWLIAQIYAQPLFGG